MDNTVMSRRKADRKKAIISKLKNFVKKRKEITFAYIHGSFAEDLPFADIVLLFMWMKILYLVRKLQITA